MTKLFFGKQVLSFVHMLYLVDVTNVYWRKGDIFQRRHRRDNGCHGRGLDKLLHVLDDDEDGEAADDDEEDDPDGPPDVAHVAIEVWPSVQADVNFNNPIIIYF